MPCSVDVPTIAQDDGRRQLGTLRLWRGATPEAAVGPAGNNGPVLSLAPRARVTKTATREHGSNAALSVQAVGSQRLGALPVAAEGCHQGVMTGTGVQQSDQPAMTGLAVVAGISRRHPTQTSSRGRRDSRIPSGVRVDVTGAAALQSAQGRAAGAAGRVQRLL
jgi:hypothetical protein